MAAELGVLAFKLGYADWVESTEQSGLAPHVLRALDTLRKAGAALN
ncbi:hypothetical protein V6N00_00065 [Tersicoccus sp. MR15.9]